MRYPTHGGLIVPPTELGFHAPTPEQLATRRLCTNHHGYFPKRNYNHVRFALVFRNLITNVFPMIGDEHADLHIDYDAPRKPRDSTMVEVLDDYLAVNGVIECIHEKQTRQTYRIMPEEWRHIKKGYQSGTRQVGRRSFMATLEPAPQ